MAARALEELVSHKVSVFTNDGRHVIGKLRGFDKQINILLTDAEERVYSMDSPVEVVPLGFVLLRGDNCAMVALLNTAKDAQLDLLATYAAPFKPIVH